jgi:hypothetical protein
MFLCITKTNARGNFSYVLLVCGGFLHGFLCFGDALARTPESVTSNPDF